MKVLHLSTEKDWRGGEQQLVYLHQELIKCAVDSIIYAHKGSPVHDYCQNHQLPHETANLNSAYNIKTVSTLISYCSDNNIDLIHAHTSKGHTISVIAAILGNKPDIVLSRRVDFKVKDNWFSRFKYNYPKIRKIICVSKAIEKLTEPDITDKNKLTTIHSGIDIHKFNGIASHDYLRKKLNISKDSILVGNTSAIADHKDYFTFVDTAEIACRSNNNLLFLIIGNGPLFNEIKDYISTKGLSDKILMTGFIEDITHAMKSLDLFLFTSKTEGLGTSVLDAMAAEIPIVATAAGGVPEMIENNHNGFLVEVKNSKKLAERTLQLIENVDLAAKFTRNAKSTLEKFSYQETARQTLTIYKEILR